MADCDPFANSTNSSCEVNVTLSGQLASMLLAQLATTDRTDYSGLLFGHRTPAPKRLRDDEGAHAEPDIVTVLDYRICCDTPLFSQNGVVSADVVRRTILSSRLPLVGWFRARRESHRALSILERSVCKSIGGLFCMIVDTGRSPSHGGSALQSPASGSTISTDILSWWTSTSKDCTHTAAVPISISNLSASSSKEYGDWRDVSRSAAFDFKSSSDPSDAAVNIISDSHNTPEQPSSWVDSAQQRYLRTSTATSAICCSKAAALAESQVSGWLASSENTYGALRGLCKELEDVLKEAALVERKISAASVTLAAPESGKQGE